MVADEKSIVDWVRSFSGDTVQTPIVDRISDVQCVNELKVHQAVVDVAYNKIPSSQLLLPANVICIILIY